MLKMHLLDEGGLATHVGAGQDHAPQGVTTHVDRVGHEWVHHHGLHHRVAPTDDFQL